MKTFRIYFDSNSLWGDPLLSKPTLGERLLRYAAEGRCQLHLSPVVIGELSRKELAGLNEHHKELASRIKSIGAMYGDTSQLLAQLNAFIVAAETLVAERYYQMVANGGVFIQPWPTYSGEAMVRRELEQRRPFLKKEVGTIGHRDTVIWLGLLELAVSFPDDTIIFVTNDDGFKHKKQMHDDLLTDLTAQGVDPGRIKLYPACYPLLEFLEGVPPRPAEPPAATEPISEEPADTLEVASWRAAMTAALWEYNETLKDLSWAPSRDLHDGGYSRPDWEIGLPVEFENPQLAAIDGPFEVSISSNHPILDEPVNCAHQVTFTFTGAMSKFDWYGLEEDSDLYSLIGDLNEHYVLAEAARSLKLSTTVIYHSASDEASVETLDAVTVL